MPGFLASFRSLMSSLPLVSLHRSGTCTTGIHTQPGNGSKTRDLAGTLHMHARSRQNRFMHAARSKVSAQSILYHQVPTQTRRWLAHV